MKIVDNKLERFAKDIMTDVEKKRQQIIESVDEKLDEKYDVCETQYLTDAYNYIQNEYKKIDNEKNEILSRTMMTCKKKRLLKREEIIDSTFASAKEKLIQFTKGELYEEHLFTAISKGIKQVGDGRLTVYLAPEDSNRIEKLKQSFNDVEFKAESKKREMIGGFKMVNHDSNIFLDESFYTLLYEQKTNFLERCKLDIE